MTNIQKHVPQAVETEILDCSLLSPERDLLNASFLPEVAIAGSLATTAITGILILPLVLAPVNPFVFNTEVKLFSQLAGTVASLALGCLSPIFEDRAKKRRALNLAAKESLNDLLNAEVNLDRAVNILQAKKVLVDLVEQTTPPWQHERWVMEFGLLGLLTPPMMEPVPQQSPHSADFTIADAPVASADTEIERRYVNPDDVAQLEMLSEQHPEYIRLDARWVQELIDSSTERDMSKRANHHFYLCGETQSGKSTLAGVIISGISARSESHAIVAGHDPKKEPDGVDITRWLCNFTYKIDGLTGTEKWYDLAQNLAQGQTERVSKVGGSCAGVPEFILMQDEVDTIYGGGKGFGELIPQKTAEKLQTFWSYGVKYQAGLRGHMVFMGQSPLSGDTGFKRPTLKNICFIAMGQTSSYILSNPKDFLNHVSEEVLQVLSDTCSTFEKLGYRYALIRPTRGNPYVAIIPKFDVNAVQNKNQDWYEEIAVWATSLEVSPTNEEVKTKWTEITKLVLTPEGVSLLQEHINKYLANQKALN